MKNKETSSKLNKKFNLYIIYSIIEQQDQNDIINNFNILFEFNHGNYITPFSICYYPCFRNINEMEEELMNDGMEIPQIYKNIFGENVYFL